MSINIVSVKIAVGRSPFHLIIHLTHFNSAQHFPSSSRISCSLGLIFNLSFEASQSRGSSTLLPFRIAFCLSTLLNVTHSFSPLLLTSNFHMIDDITTLTITIGSCQQFEWAPGVTTCVDSSYFDTQITCNFYNCISILMSIESHAASLLILLIFFILPCITTDNTRVWRLRATFRFVSSSAVEPCMPCFKTLTSLLTLCNSRPKKLPAPSSRVIVLGMQLRSQEMFSTTLGAQAPANAAMETLSWTIQLKQTRNCGQKSRQAVKFPAMTKREAGPLNGRLRQHLPSEQALRDGGHLGALHLLVNNGSAGEPFVLPNSSKEA